MKKQKAGKKRRGRPRGRRFYQTSIMIPPDIKFELQLAAGVRGESFCCFARQVLSEFIRPGSYPEFSEGVTREFLFKNRHIHNS